MSLSKKFFILVFLLAWFGILFYFTHLNVFNIHFGDEDDNFLLGRYILQGKDLYKDLFSHHQPLGYILSAFIQGTTGPSSIYELVMNHRAALLVWAFGWTALMGLYFGWGAIVFSLFYESTKKGLFGDQFLSESVAVYPMVFLIFLLFSSTITKSRRFTFFLIGLSSAIITMLHLPSWPTVIFLLLGLTIKYRRVIKNDLAWLLLGGAAVLITVLPFIDLRYYLYNSFYINNAYYLRYGVNPAEGIRLKAFVTPFIGLFPSVVSYQATIIRTILIGFWILVATLILNRRLIVVTSVFLLLGLLNLRFVEPGKMFYQGFHQSLWFASLIAICAVWTTETTNKVKGKLVKLGFLAILVGFFTIVFYQYKSLALERGNRTYAYGVSHARTIGIASILGKISTHNDTLFVVPGDWLLYWSVNVKPASTMLNYYGWMKNVPEIRNRVQNLMSNNPPTFFYCIEDCRSIDNFDTYFKKYREIIQDNGEQTGLFILRAAIDQTRLEKFRVEKINLRE